MDFQITVKSRKGCLVTKCSSVRSLNAACTFSFLIQSTFSASISFSHSSCWLPSCVLSNFLNLVYLFSVHNAISLFIISIFCHCHFPSSCFLSTDPSTFHFTYFLLILMPCLIVTLTYCFRSNSFHK